MKRIFHVIAVWAILAVSLVLTANQAAYAYSAADLTPLKGSVTAGNTSTIDVSAFDGPIRLSIIPAAGGTAQVWTSSTPKMNGSFPATVSWNLWPQGSVTAPSNFTFPDQIQQIRITGATATIYYAVTNSNFQATQCQTDSIALGAASKAVTVPMALAGFPAVCQLNAIDATSTFIKGCVAGSGTVTVTTNANATAAQLVTACIILPE